MCCESYVPDFSFSLSHCSSPDPLAAVRFKTAASALRDPPRSFFISFLIVFSRGNCNYTISVVPGSLFLSFSVKTCNILLRRKDYISAEKTVVAKQRPSTGSPRRPLATGPSQSGLWSGHSRQGPTPKRGCASDVRRPRSRSRQDRPRHEWIVLYIDGEKQVGLESRELASGWRGLKKEQERQENLHLDSCLKHLVPMQTAISAHNGCGTSSFLVAQNGSNPMETTPAT